MSNDTTTQSQSTKSTFQPPSWQGCGRQFVNMHLVFLLILMTPSIVSLAVIWLLANTLHKGLELGLTQVESGVSTAKSEAERFNTQVLSPFSKSLNQLSDVAHKTASEAEVLLSTFLSGIKKYQDILVLKNK